MLEEFAPQWKTAKLEKKCLNELQKDLYSQQCLQNLIQESIRKATSIPIENLRASKGKPDSNDLEFVTTFNLNNKSVFPLIQTTFK